MGGGDNTNTTPNTTTDTTAPINTTAANFINSGASSTSTTQVTLAVSATDNVGVTGYYVSETSTTPSASATGWQSITSTTSYSSTSVSFTLSSGDGEKTVYVWFKDQAGNVSTVASDTITLSTCSGGALKWANQTGARADFSFNGTGIRWIVTRGGMLGKAKVSLDGVVMGMVDLFNPTPQFQLVLQKTGLSPGNHSIGIEVSGEKNIDSIKHHIDIDAFEVVP